MKNRIIFGIMGAVLAYIFIYYGGLPFFIVLNLIMIASILEFYRMCTKEEIPVIRWWGVSLSIFILFQTYFINNYSELSKNILMLTVTLSVCGTLIMYLLDPPPDDAFYGFTATLAGVMYVGWLMNHILLLRDLKPGGREFLLTAVIATWTADTSAFFTGMKFGRRRLHKYSPNKTRAGAAGGVIGASLAFLVLRRIFDFEFLTFSQALFAGALIGFLAISGDLSESLFKRGLGIKDSGGFLPGHGGFLDRTDSLLFTVPFMYYFSLWVLR